MAGKRGREFWLDLYDELQETGETITAASKRLKLSAKTISNWFSRIRKGEVKREVGSGKSGSGNREVGKGKKSSAKPRASGKSESRQDSGKASPPEGGKKLAPGSDEKPTRKPHPGWANLIPAEPGNQRARKHGGYSKYLPPDVQAELDTYGRNDLLDVLEEIRLTKGRLIMVTRSRAEWDAKQEYSELTDADYQLDEIGDKVSAEGRERTTKRSRPKFEDLEDQLTRRLAWLQQVQDQLSRRVSLTADEAAAARRSIMERAEEEGWTATRTGDEIEKLGLEAPFTLQQRIRSELALAEPEEPEGGMTDDELEALSAEYEQQTQGEPEWLEERREEVQEIHKAKDAERKGE